MLNLTIKALLAGRNILISGGAGVGKTHLLNQIVNSRRFKRVQVLAPTAIAAVASGGRTVHSFFKFRLASNISELKISNKDRQELIEELEDISLLVIDEISMLSAGIFDMIDLFLRQCAKPPTLLLVGDFYQLAPISKDNDANCQYAFFSPRWADYDFALLELNTQHRMQDTEFFSHLAKLRLGNISDELSHYFSKFICDLHSKPLEDHTVICGTNQEASAINAQQLRKHPGELLSTHAAFGYTKKPPSEAQKRSMLAQTPLDATLNFKIGCRVIVTMNNAAFGVYNGQQAIVADVNFTDSEITLEDSNGKLYKVRSSNFYFDDALMNVSDEESSKATYVVSGFALKLAYAITIHKSQGMSIKRLVCKCDRIFAAGQLYVAFSRASDVSNFHIAFYGNDIAFKRMLYAKARPNSAVAQFYSTIPRLNLHKGTP